MSSSYIVEPQEGASKKDDTLILMVNDNGVISVDQDTLQNLILNQSNANVSVVRLGQTDNDAAEGNITLTVDPPPFVASESNVANSAADPAGLVDPFMEMDPEQLERLETALQSEEAKQILGENVTAMLDMLTVEEQQNSIRYSIELDHCYTSRFSPSQPKPADPLPDMSSSDMDDSMCLDSNKSTVPMMLPVSSANVNNTSITPMKQKVASIPPKIVKQPVSLGGRPRRASTAMQPITTTPKSSISTNARASNLAQENKSNTKDVNEPEDDQLFSSSSESSESEESFSDSGFGPKPFRKGVRARGGRRGLTTRGGSMAAARRRGSNKHMDSEQVRRLDLEMAAAVNAMKSPEKEDKSEKHSPGKVKKPLKTFGGKKKEDGPTPSTYVNESPPVEPNVIQTTNQVKANLISANMFKGDMILTKPGQDRNNQKVVYIQKQVAMSPNDMKALGIKKQVMIPKSKLITSQNSKVPMAKDAKAISSPATVKGVTGNVQPATFAQTVTPMEVQMDTTQHQAQMQKTVSPTVIKTKSVELKKEKKKTEPISETPVQAVESTKPVEIKTPATVAKKVVKKEHRKSDPHVVEALGPALFSTPDIIRRVGSTESKVPDSPVTTTPTNLSAVINNANISTPGVSTASIPTVATPSLSTAISPINAAGILHEPMDTNISATDSTNDGLARLDTNASLLPESLEDDKMDSKAAIAELLQPALEAASKPSPSKEMPPSMEQNSSSKHVVSESGIEGDDHLLATLGMEAAKQIPNDEELLAEALLLQETLGVDLDHSGLVDPTPEIPDSILSSPIMEPPPVVPSTIKAAEPMPIAPPVQTPVSATPLAPSTPEMKSESTVKKDSKPIQIVRHGRVITLPPIEAPATRSKRLQAKTDNQQPDVAQAKVEKKPQVQQHHQQQLKVKPIVIKTERSSRTPSHVSLQKQDMIYDMDDDDEEEEANSDSEDDPNRLWCICRQPHNNRFMICCDICQDWFHGKCVNVTKAMGEDMENKGVEWVCPNCKTKKSEESKPKSTARKQRHSTDSTASERSRTLSVSNTSTSDGKVTSNTGKNSGASAGVTHCVVCKKEARKSSIYCSDACILAHAEKTSTQDKPTPSPQPVKTPKADTSKSKADVRVVVFDKKTGNVLTGSNAPTASNLKAWLKENPSYEVVKPNNANTIQLGGKTFTAIQTQGIKTNKPLQGKTSAQAKMVYSKVAGSKQTVLAPSTKKTVLTMDTLPGRATASPQHRPKQNAVVTPYKTPTSNLKQTTIKSVVQPNQQQQQQQTPQKPIAASTPKVVSVKKPAEPKPSTSQQKPVQSPKEQIATKTPPPRKPETEPIRLTVRKTLAELLTSRVKEANDLAITEEEISELALQIELEMFKFFKDTGQKYKSKYRSLVFNIKDTKNLTLFRKIADRSLSPAAVVKLSPDEMASQELAEWREKENKHQLEMIKKNELDLMAQAKSIVVKTHKGEQIIENAGAIDSIDPKTSVQDIVTALNSGDSISSTMEEDKLKEDNLLDESKKPKTLEDEKKKKEKDRDRDKRRGRSRDRDSSHKRDRSRHKHSKDRDRSRDRKSKGKHKDRDRTREKDHDKSRGRDRKKDKDRDKDRKDKHKRSRSSSRSHSKSRHKEHKDKHKKDDEKKKEGSKIDGVGMEKPIEDRLWRHIEEETTTNTLDGNESDISDREPSSTVTIKTPDINEELDREIDRELEKEIDKSAKLANESALATTAKGSITVWRGFVYMADVAKFFVTAQNVSGNSKEFLEGLPETFDVVGRISPSIVWEYLAKMKKSGTKDILIIKLTATNDEEKIPYITLYSYLNSRNRLGVLGTISSQIKDFYIVPFSHGSKLPPVLLPLDGPGLEENHQHLLLGIIVVHRSKKRVVTNPSSLTPMPAKIAKKEPLQIGEKNYTPPVTSHLLAGSSIKDESMTPPSSPRASISQVRIVTQEVKQSFSIISKVVPELSSKITLESSSSSDKMQLDDDEPYSPGEPVDIVLEDDEDALSSSSSLKPAGLDAVSIATTTTPIKSPSQLQREMEEVSRQIEEEKMQIQNISSSFLSEASTTLPGLGLDPPDNSEVYSPSDARSFTPPPQGIPKLTQPILDKVSNIMIPPNLQEILANVKRQESTKVDPYLPSKPSATFLTTANSAMYQNPEKYSPTYSKTSNVNTEVQSSPRKETKSTLSSLSDADLCRKAEEELAALAAASAPTVASSVPSSQSPAHSE
ncbi:uncharacterized protein LOC100679883 isoform X2 [Nasonia vitripennis]|uniref:Death-inducer obliterator 1 n=1 Tax=Nasonia vitripennis TaxID=7425 RepID=A0A7M7H1H8_NASVI|nr:uncharacterized protein LOC100679883 isoform X2 [Nasonia vitripennis]